MHMLIFGLGYTARRLAARLTAQSWQVTATSRSGVAGTHRLDSPAVAAAIGTATHILSSVPPAGVDDPVLAFHAAALAAAPARWLGYLSSSGVYGDTAGAWVDETAPLHGRRRDRIAADRAWQGLRDDVSIFRLPGIYGPGRSAVDAVRAGTAHRVDAGGQVFSRIHVDDIVRAVVASFTRGVPGIYNIADGWPAPQSEVVDAACALLGRAPLPTITVDDPALSPAMRGFYSENRRIAAGRAARELGFTPRFATFREGLRACV